MSEALINKGIKVIGEKPRVGAPVIIVGTARGGTSMIAGALAHLGVFMGDLAVPPVYEDTRLSAAFEHGSEEEAESIVKDYSTRESVWGWKRPSSIDHLPRVHRLFNNPRYIFVFKDIFAIANRNSISMMSDTLVSMEMALVQYKSVIQFLRNNEISALLVSYDKAISHKDEFIRCLIDFCDLKPTNLQRQAADVFIDPAPIAYLDASRITKAQGRLDVAQGSVIAGWARYLYQEKPAMVKIYINDVHVITIAANEQRRDLTQKFNKACGFTYNLKDGLKKGDVVRAKVSDEVRDLMNSPFLLS